MINENDHVEHLVDIKIASSVLNVLLLVWCLVVGDMERKILGILNTIKYVLKFEGNQVSLRE